MLQEMSRANVMQRQCRTGETSVVPRAHLLLRVSVRQVTTKGVQYIARGCPNMSVLNLYHCGKVKVCFFVASLFAYTCYTQVSIQRLPRAEGCTMIATFPECLRGCS